MLNSLIRAEKLAKVNAHFLSLKLSTSVLAYLSNFFTFELSLLLFTPTVTRAVTTIVFIIREAAEAKSMLGTS